MKILHIAPLSPYNVGWSYQDNLLPKYQRKLGHDVCVVVSPFENTANGKVDVGETDFILEDGIHVYRRRRLFGNGPFGKAISFTNVKDVINDFKPDFIMIHSLMTLSVFQAIKYKKHRNPNCVIIQDNHLDENIGRRKTKLLTDAYYWYWRLVNKFAKKYVSKYYGVTPWRQDFIINRFGIEQEKTDLLIMGADTDEIDFSRRNDLYNEFHNKYCPKGEFLIVTGGKIEKNKKIHLLMSAVEKIKGVKLLVFGTVSDDYKNEIDSSCNENVIMVGWKAPNEINDIFLGADMAIFPGQHSVLWEQACACKIPCLFAKWDRMDYLNNGGNSDFIADVSVKGLKQVIMQYLTTATYKEMDRVAKSEATDIFSYVSIAEKSLELISTNTQLNKTEA